MNEFNRPGVSRRTCLQGLAGWAGMAGLSSGAAMAADITDFSSPVQRLRAVMQLRGALDDRVTLEWLSGRVYGVVGAERTPLFTLNAVAFARYRQTAEDVYSGRRVEVVYHGDLDSGEQIERFTNPYTGAEVEIPEQRTPLARFEVGTDGLRLPARMGPMSIATESQIMQPLVHDGRIWLRMDTRNTFTLPDGKVASHYAESTVYTASAAAVADPARLSVDAELSYTNVMSWRPWMGMGGQEGHTLSSAHGEKVESLEDIPAYMQRFVGTQHPDLAADAAAVLDARAAHGGS